MIVQERRDSLRVFRQLDHALASGRMALAWSPPLPFRSAFAIALHDFAWSDDDREPVWDPETRAPRTFRTIPRQARSLVYSLGVGRLAMIDDFAAALASLHYAAFVPDPRSAAGCEPPAGAGEVAIDGAPAPRVDRGLIAILRHLDDLSLYVCLACPGSESRPDWLTDERVRARPGGPEHRLTWTQPSRLEIDPFPFLAPVDLRIPCRDLPRRPYDSPEDLRAEWSRTPVGEHRVALVPAA